MAWRLELPINLFKMLVLLFLFPFFLVVTIHVSKDLLMIIHLFSSMHYYDLFSYSFMDLHICSAQNWRYSAKQFIKAYPKDVIVHCEFWSEWHWFWVKTFVPIFLSTIPSFIDLNESKSSNLSHCNCARAAGQ